MSQLDLEELESAIKEMEQSPQPHESQQAGPSVGRQASPKQDRLLSKFNKLMQRESLTPIAEKVGEDSCFFTEKKSATKASAAQSCTKTIEKELLFLDGIGSDGSSEGQKAVSVTDSEIALAVAEQINATSEKHSDSDNENSNVVSNVLFD